MPTLTGTVRAADQSAGWAYVVTHSPALGEHQAKNLVLGLQEGRR